MSNLKKVLRAREVTSFLFLAALFVIVGLINPKFFSVSSISACFNSSVVYTLVAVGMAFAILLAKLMFR